MPQFDLLQKWFGDFFTTGKLIIQEVHSSAKHFLIFFKDDRPTKASVC